MGKFLHIYIDPKKEITQEMIEKKINLALDWFRYDDKVYIVYTTSDAKKWQARLLNFVKGGGKLFICELDLSNRSGWHTKSFWEWLKQER